MKQSESLTSKKRTGGCVRCFTTTGEALGVRYWNLEGQLVILSIYL